MPSQAWKARANATRLAQNAAYTQPAKARRGTRELSQANSGTTSTVAAKVAVNSHCSRSTPAAMPIASRTGRSMKYPAKMQKNTAKPVSDAPTSSGSARMAAAMARETVIGAAYGKETPARRSVTVHRRAAAAVSRAAAGTLARPSGPLRSSSPVGP